MSWKTEREHLSDSLDKRWTAPLVIVPGDDPKYCILLGYIKRLSKLILLFYLRLLMSHSFIRSVSSTNRVYALSTPPPPHL